MQLQRQRHLQELLEELLEISSSYQQAVIDNTLPETAKQLQTKLKEIIEEIKQYRFEEMN